MAGDRTVKAGRAVGITTPVTGFRLFMNWAREARASFGSTGVVPVIASVETTTKPGVRAWGVPVFATVV